MVLNILQFHKSHLISVLIEVGIMYTFVGSLLPAESQTVFLWAPLPWSGSTWEPVES